MSKLFLIATLATVVLAGGFLKTHIHNHLLTEEQVSEINNRAKTWTADYNLVKGMTREQALSKLGAILKPSDYPEADWGALIENYQTPENFDARTQWPDCVNYIRDQEQCGSCWAFGASEVLSDRYCIKGKKVLLSPQYLVSCDSNNYGCNGGFLDEAWKFMETKGIPSDQCVGYVSGGGETGNCPETCDDGSSVTFYKAKSTKAFTSISSIQLELMANGPIEVGFIVYEDFMAYKKGIYQYTGGAQLGGHAVKIVGWGHDQETAINYWICANSWSSGWGENGYFRIAWGECDIEGNAIAGVPDL
jgi:cathepsin B